MENESVTIFEICWYSFSVILFIGWLVRTNRGRNSLSGTTAKDHTIQLLDLLFVLFLYLITGLAGAVIAKRADSFWDGKNIGSLVTLAGYGIMVIVILIIGTHRFTGGLAGFGISAKGLGGVFLRGLGYYAVGGGLTLFTLFLTVQICKGIGYDVIQKHSVLEMIEQKPPIHSLFALFFTAAIAAPIAEELMFRGLLQNFMVRLFADYYKIVQKVRTLQSASEKPSETNRTGNPEADDFRCRWMGIVVTSIIFGVFHAQWQQWPALFVLSMVLGYSYERRGSLLIPIFTHAFFNTLPLTVMVVKVYFCV